MQSGAQGLFRCFQLGVALLLKISDGSVDFTVREHTFAFEPAAFRGEPEHFADFQDAAALHFAVLDNAKNAAAGLHAEDFCASRFLQTSRKNLGGARGAPPDKQGDGAGIHLVTLSPGVELKADFKKAAKAGDGFAGAGGCAGVWDGGEIGGTEGNRYPGGGVGRDAGQ